MEFDTVLKARRSIRKFNDKEIDISIIKSLVEKAIEAPSWKNSQVTRYYAVLDKDKKEKIAKAMPDFNQKASLSASCLIVSTVVKYRSGYNRDGSFATNKEKGWQMYDCGVSNAIFTLAAAEVGLGSVIMGYFDDDLITQELNIPESEEVSSVIALGYYDESVDRPKRKSVDDILSIK